MMREGVRDKGQDCEDIWRARDVTHDMAFIENKGEKEHRCSNVKRDDSPCSPR